MDFIITLLIPIIVVAIPVATFIVAFSLWQRSVDKRNRRSPLTRSMLRAPGESLRNGIEDLQIEINFLVLISFMTPFFFFSTYISRLYFLGKEINAIEATLITVLVGIALSVLMRKVFRSMEELRKRRLGMEGEIATGEELNQLMLDGCRVFHDVPFDYGNIDHVVVSTSGVFVVETKTLTRSNEHGSEKATVDYENNVLRFSDRTWKIPNKQLETGSKWLSQYLTNAVGMKIECERMLALPGYYIEQRIGKGSVFVFNPKQPKKFFLNSRNVLSPQQVQQIAHQIEQLCRDVEPSFRNK